MTMKALAKKSPVSLHLQAEDPFHHKFALLKSRDNFVVVEIIKFIDRQNLWVWSPSEGLARRVFLQNIFYLEM
jgi:hypothetical protein